MRALVHALAVSWAIAGVAAAQEGGVAAQHVPVPARLTLDEALRIAEARSPAITAAAASLQIAEADAMAARQRPNPVFAATMEGLPFSQESRPPFWDNQQLTLTVEQDLETGGRRGLRDRSSSSGIESARAAARDRARRLRLDVQRAYLHAVLAKADHDVAHATLGDIDRVLAINRARFEQGELSGVELRRLQVERHRFADDLLTADLGLKNARAALLAVMHVGPLDQAFETAASLGDPVVEPDRGAAAMQQALATRPDLIALRGEQAHAQIESALQRAIGKPVWTIGGGYQRDFGVNALVLLARVPLPFASRNQGGISRADAGQKLAEAATEAATTEAALEIQLASNGVAAHRSRVDAVQREYLRNAREARDIVLAAYRAGAATLIDFLDAQRALDEARRVENRALFDYRVSMCQLESALGPGAGVGAAPR
jgi:cobalt-zinc-cadmium efflux system outer membrane protein